MLFRRIREERWIKNNVKTSLSQIEVQLNAIRGRQAIAICPLPTEDSWQGVTAATNSLFKERVFQIPQFYSHPVYSSAELQSIAHLLIQNECETVVFSGYLPYFDQLIFPLAKAGKKVNVIYHGSHTSVLEDVDSAKHFESLINLAKTGIIDKIGFVKKDLDKSFHKLIGQEFYPIHLKTDEALFSIQPPKLDGLNIGVLTHDSFRKNIYNMISAGLLHPQATVHLKEKYSSGYLGNSERIQTHKYSQSQRGFFEIMGSMSMNFYVTFSECWGQFVNESLALGTPCLTSNVSAVLDFDDDLKKLLTVEEFDNDHAIYMKSLEVLENLDYFKTSGPKYISKLNTIADEKLLEFLK